MSIYHDDLCVLPTYAENRACGRESLTRGDLLKPTAIETRGREVCVGGGAKNNSAHIIIHHYYGILRPNQLRSMTRG